MEQAVRRMSVANEDCPFVGCLLKHVLLSTQLLFPSYPKLLDN